MVKMNRSTEGCNLEIMGFPFFAEKVSAKEAFRRRDVNVNNIVGGTQNITKGPYIPVEFDVTTHVFVKPNRPDMYNKIFQKMMAEPVEVISPELGGKYQAMVVIKPDHVAPKVLELSINIKEVPGRNSKIPGEKFTVPKRKLIEINKNEDENNEDEE